MHQIKTLGYMPHGTGTLYPFNEVFDKKVNILKDGWDGVDALCLWGGEDISSSYYDEPPHRYNQNPYGKPSQRDKDEWKAMIHAKMHGIPIIGVCRGAQFLCAFAGGKLIQHTTGHHSDHDVMTNTGEVFEVTSCHHQMMYPFEVPKYQLLAWSMERRSTCYEGGDNKEIANTAWPEVEAVYFPNVKGLAIQGHPEWAGAASRFATWSNQMVREYLIKEEVAV